MSSISNHNLMEFGFPDLAAAELTLIVNHKQTNKNKKHKTSWEPTAFTGTLSQGRRKTEDH